MSSKEIEHMNIRPQRRLDWDLGLRAGLFKSNGKDLCRMNPIGKSVNGRRGFTLIELLVVIAIIAILAAMLLPALGRAKLQATGVQCMSQTHQMVLAWHMYAMDNKENVVLNKRNGALGGWVNGIMAFSAADNDNTNTSLLINGPAAAPPLLGPYVANNYSLFHCPVDRSQVTGQSPRVRSYSMNGFVGTPYPDGVFDVTPPYPYVVYRKTTDFYQPANIYVFLDEHPDSIDDGWYIFCINSDPTEVTTWSDLPASGHGGAGGFAFADGHSEIHKWLSPATVQPVNNTGAFNDAVGPSTVDINWVAQHSTALK
jgi:prepilin-type N-terminal cleavage/methylation domain-containing protein/prepilin-type processing-associated H-X9-DG protein